MHLPRLRFLALACLLAAPLLAAGAEPAPHGFSSLEETMPYATFRKLGLDKLSPEQLEGLNAWLREHGMPGQAPAAPGAGAAAANAAAASAPARAFSSRIAGKFSGWNFDTVLTLENGQKWRVLDHDPVLANPRMNPKVTLEPGMFGSWSLSVEGVTEVAHVAPVP
ncbi:hypothetical protein MBSD_n1945 [Mizugakiibacter sediminis]|uniref:Secreted protein n=1 Tax=Mizugakiibacter sediminis TaxID=1475481 RepID=A0A0K8QP34_9GAMM|nr:hypothetical protein [Mizugakiibacter sediminis]GAP66634.1 hypothetical protein MBSD_n1945 [Mizugakiibacter sediminis]